MRWNATGVTNGSSVHVVQVPIGEESIQGEDAEVEMSVLERSDPVDEGNVADTVVNGNVTQDQVHFCAGSIDDEDADIEMPVFKYSVIVNADYFNDTVVDMHVALGQIHDMEDEATPIVESTFIQEENDDFNFSDVSFSVHNPIDEVEQIREASFHVRLTETILEDRGVTYTIIESGTQRQTRVLVSSIGYAYTVKCNSKTSVTWRCTSRSKAIRCPVTVLQKGDHFVQRKEHVSPALTDRDLRLRVYSKVRATASSNVFQPARTIAEHILTEERGTEDVERPISYLSKRAANRVRSKFRPKEPNTLDFEVVGEPFKRHGQLFTINACIEREGQSKQLPLIFVLMSRRTKPDCTAVFNAIIDRVGEAKFAGFVADFEVAVWQALREIFPGKKIKGCAFHWSQASWRRVRDDGLSEVYRRRGGVHRFVRMLMALQSLPPTHIVLASPPESYYSCNPALSELHRTPVGQWFGVPAT